eukprot:7634071-Ditylum_brightwellii.AAC.1
MPPLLFLPPPAPDPFFYSKVSSCLNFSASSCQLGSSQFWPPPTPDPILISKCMSGKMVVSCPPPAPNYALNIYNSALMLGSLRKRILGYISLLYDMVITPEG